MRKSLLLFATFITLLFISQNVLAQELIPDQKIQDIKNEKQEILNLSLTSETVLDSIVYYSYDSKGDSVRLLKKMYDVDESGGFETRYEYVWINEQWVFSTKHELTFNELDQLVLSEYFNWDTDLSEWIDDRSMTITYDENGYDNLFTYLRWNDELARWDNYYKDDSNYDSNGKRLKYVEWLGNDLNEWEYFYKEENTYNPNGSLNDSYIAFWNPDIDAWENYHKEEFYYHESGLTNYRLYYLWMTGDWRLSLKTDYFYTESEHYDSLTTYQRIEDEWILYSQRNFLYDNTDNPIIVTDLKWINEAWENDQISEFEYDQNNNRTLYIFSVWDENSDTWIYQYKNEDSYDDMGNMLMSSGYNWSVEEMKWIGYRFNEYFFDEDSKHLIDIYYEWDDVNGDWYLNEKGFYYRSIVLHSPELTADNFIVYPNPVESMLTVKSFNELYKECSIVSLTGQLIEQVKLQDSETRINMESFPAGIYYLQLKSGNEIVSKKIIKH